MSTVETGGGRRQSLMPSLDTRLTEEEAWQDAAAEPESTTFQCEQCGYVAKSMQGLRTHVTRKHGAAVPSAKKQGRAKPKRQQRSKRERKQQIVKPVKAAAFDADAAFNIVVPPGSSVFGEDVEAIGKWLAEGRALHSKFSS